MDKKTYESTRFICNLISEGAVAATTSKFPFEHIGQYVKNLLAEAVEHNVSAAYYADPKAVTEHLITIYRLNH